MMGKEAHPSGHKGILLDILIEASSSVGITPRFIRRPWLRCQKLVLEGQAQSLFAMIKTPERAVQFQFPEKSSHYLFAGNYVIFYRADPKRRSIMEKTAFNIANNLPIPEAITHGFGAPHGYIVEGILRNKHVLAKNAYDMPTAIKLIRNDRLDGYVVDQHIGRANLMAPPNNLTITHTENLVLTDLWYAPFNRSFYLAHKEKIDRFWQELPKIRRKHEIKLAKLSKD